MLLAGCGPAVSTTSGGEQGGGASSGGVEATSTSPDPSVDDATSASAADTGRGPTDATSAGTSGSTGPGPEVPEPLVGCEADRFRSGATTDAVHMISIYEAGAVEFDVDWSIAGGTLLLSSHEPVGWRINLLDGGVLDEVIVNGPLESTVDAPEGLAVLRLDDPGLQASSYPSIDGERARQRFELLEDVTVTGMDLCHDGATGAVLTPDNALAEAYPPPAVEPDACLSMRQVPTLCLASLEGRGRYTLVSLDSGDLCTVNEHEDWYGPSSGGWATFSGREALSCEPPPSALELRTFAVGDLETGRVEWTDIPCSSVSSGYLGEILLSQAGVISIFEDEHALQNGIITAEVDVGGARPFTLVGDVLFAAGEDDSIDRWDVNTGEPLEPLELGAFENLTAAEDSLLLGSDDGSFRFHDPRTGALLETRQTDFTWPGQVICRALPPT